MRIIRGLSMPIERARVALGLVFFQRCFYLFVGVLALIAAGLMLEPDVQGRITITAINLLLDVTGLPRSAARNCRSRSP